MASSPVFRNALPLQSMLLEYRVEQILGAGGFGITYRARDVNLDKDVAIKEYLPGELAMRAADGRVLPQSTQHEEGYQWGLDRFLQEARTLAKFSHPNIVRVLRYFEANATAYMAMDYERGDPLKTVLQHDPQPPEAKLKALVAPLLEGLAVIHAQGFLHRDIKPENIFVRADGSPVLIDFGAARQALGGSTRSLTAILTPGYAPLEQYSGEGKQGPWTDLYAMAGVLYRAVTNKNPPDAVTRIRGDTIDEGLGAARGRYGGPFLRAIEWGLKIDEKQRPQSVAQWKATLLAERRVSPPAQVGVERRVARPAAIEPPRPSRWPVFAAVAVVALVVLAGLGIWRRHQAARIEAAQAAEAAAQEAAVEARKREEAELRYANLPPPAADAAASASQSASSPPSPRSAPAQANDAADASWEFKLADANGDGYLSPDEARRFPLLAREFQRVDRNGDGRISLQEFIEARRLLLERRYNKK